MPAAEVADWFRSEVDDLRSTVEDAERARKARKLKQGSYHSVVELVHLQLLARFEVFLERLFYTCALGESGISDVSPEVDLLSEAQVDLMLYSDGRRREKYLAWLPFDATLGRAETYLSGGAPFGRLKYRVTEIEQLAAATIVRNSIAHSGEHAFSELKKLASARSYIVIRPADFLCSVRGPSTEGTLFLVLFQSIAAALVAPTAAEANMLLNPERGFTIDASTTPPGDYQCSICGAKIISHAGGKLGACLKCGKGLACATCGRPQGAPNWRRVY